MACVHAATAKASTTAKCLITLSSLQWLTMANNDGDGDQFNPPDPKRKQGNVIFRRSLHPSTEEARDGGTRTR
jgi:hypothetical protein